MRSSARARSLHGASAALAVGFAAAVLGLAGTGHAAPRLAAVGASRSEAQAIVAVLTASGAAWSRGDLIGFMACYANSPSTSYVTSKGIVRGYSAIRDIYAQDFSGAADAMGQLTEDVVEVRELGRGFALVTGRYHLTQSAAKGGDASGIFTLVFHRGQKGWKIILDHSS